LSVKLQKQQFQNLWRGGHFIDNIDKGEYVRWIAFEWYAAMQHWANTNTLTYTHKQSRKLQLHRTDDERNKNEKPQTIHLF